MTGISAPVFGSKDLASCYVQYMTQHQQLDETQEGLVEFGAPVAAGTTDLRALLAFVAGVRQNLATPIVVNTPFGRTINVTTSAAGVVTIFGRDYLNQPMSETVTLGSGTTVAGVKAFKYIDALICTTSINVSFGNGPRLGLPFTASVALQEILNEGAAAGLGTLVAPVLTTPATATTGDTRGTLTPNSTMNGANTISLKCRFRNDTADGLYGVPQA